VITLLSTFPGTRLVQISTFVLWSCAGTFGCHLHPYISHAQIFEKSCYLTPYARLASQQLFHSFSSNQYAPNFELFQCFYWLSWLWVYRISNQGARLLERLQKFLCNSGTPARDTAASLSTCHHTLSFGCCFDGFGKRNQICDAVFL
jgi:hypothetical protein